MNYIKLLLCSIFLYVNFDIYSVSASESRRQPDNFIIWPAPKGEIIQWKQVDQMIPVGTILQITDVDTGLTFQAQRRAGATHADVQPITHKDTLIMKAIYQGKWSWDRRDIIVSANGKQIAASMNGMPHGFGALQNGFAGHFCIHFKGSITHAKQNIDLAHQLMIAKAGGELSSFVGQLNLTEIIEAFAIGINQGERVLHRQIVAPNFSSKYPTFHSLYIEKIKVEQMKKQLFSAQVPVKVKMKLNQTSKPVKTTLMFEFVRQSIGDGWEIGRIDDI